MDSLPVKVDYCLFCLYGGCPKRVPSIFYVKVRTFPSSDFLICSKMFILEHVNR